jgi:drug/metabolite transporter (DMT)-like permease
VAVVSALSGTAPAFTAAFTYGLLRGVERVTRRVAVGVGLVVVGGVLITV